MQTRPKPLLVVTDAATQITLPVNRNTVRLTDMQRIFPIIHELQPTGIVLDYDFLGTDTEKILRRINSNPFYSKIKVYCYKSRPHSKVDGLLLALGVQQFIYPVTNKPMKTGVATKILSYLFDNTVTPTFADAG